MQGLACVVRALEPNSQVTRLSTEFQHETGILEFVPEIRGQSSAYLEASGSFFFF